MAGKLILNRPLGVLLCLEQLQTFWLYLVPKICVHAVVVVNGQTVCVYLVCSGAIFCTGK